MNTIYQEILRKSTKKYLGRVSMNGMCECVHMNVHGSRDKKFMSIKRKLREKEAERTK